jgi:antitoxin (DNA-binding transcriptional repressor) of toxin-antitoxin stability system
MTVTLEEAQATLPEIIRTHTSGEPVQITDGGVVVATLVPAPPPPQPKPPIRLGTLRGTVLSMEHFDDPLPGFEEYMPCGCSSIRTPSFGRWTNRRS